MTVSPASSNITSATNATEDFDFFCTEMPVGPRISAAASVLSGCVGFPASVWLLWVLVQRQRSGTTNDISILNLTIMDLVFNGFAILGMLNQMVWRDNHYSSFDNILYGLNITGRPLFMACMCVDCFIAVVYPITYMKMKTADSCPRYRLLSCAAVWALSLCSGICCVLLKQRYFLFQSVLYALTVPTIVVCDLAILYSLRKPDPSGRSGVHPQKQRAMHTITTSMVMTVVCYLPTLMLPFFTLMPISEQVKHCCITIPLYIAPLLGGTIMPLLQLQSMGKLRGLQQCSRVSESPVQLTQP